MNQSNQLDDRNQSNQADDGSQSNQDGSTSSKSHDERLFERLAGEMLVEVPQSLYQDCMFGLVFYKTSVSEFRTSVGNMMSVLQAVFVIITLKESGLLRTFKFKTLSVSHDDMIIDPMMFRKLQSEHTPNKQGCI